MIFAIPRGTEKLHWDVVSLVDVYKCSIEHVESFIKTTKTINRMYEIYMALDLGFFFLTFYGFFFLESGSP